MKELTSGFTDEQLTDMGRAMERSGHKDLKEYLHWAGVSKTNEILDNGTEVPCSDRKAELEVGTEVPCFEN